MEIITVGREQGNHIVINDNYVGRRHLELIRDDTNNILVRDLNSKNGTYINGKKITGEVYLNKNDIVRIGNTTLPWRSYFEKPGNTTIESPEPKKRKPEKKPINWRNVLSIITMIISLMLMIFMLLQRLK
jgi:pSer/pThr/pTyr-binding forkhead associated (FHA) protein